jgi:CBS domain-containing protein
MEVGRIIEILCEYRHQELSADDVEVVPDLQIIDLYAARVAGDSEYLVHAGHGKVEEVYFEHWPPEQVVRVSDPDTRATRRGRGRARTRSNHRTRRSGMRIDQLMSRHVQYCAPDDTLDQAARLMWDHDCGCVPVCTSYGAPHVVGMITDRDICMAALFEGKPLRELRVANAMSREVRVCRSSDQPAAIERLMRERQIRRVPVTDDNGTLVGIVSLADFARAAERRNDAAGISGTEVGDTLAAIVEPPATVAH